MYATKLFSSKRLINRRLSSGNFLQVKKVIKTCLWSLYLKKELKLSICSIPYKDRVLTAQSCPTLCDPMDCSLPGSSVHGILKTRIVEWVWLKSHGKQSKIDYILKVPLFMFSHYSSNVTFSINKVYHSLVGHKLKRLSYKELFRHFIEEIHR